ncbi:MAG: HlyD family efflux transporter periplasmic adaptor subunit [Dehalococcoidia bacterium]|nr:HlyD family efflux transporter periplasmic adaptor subunit [Dehalococcoidia bacterium]
MQRGDLSVTVTSDGTLTAPDQFNLAFNTPGTVQTILVQEGEKVREGAMLATIDPWSQINSIKTALFSIQTAQNSIDLGCDTDHLPYNYPDLSISRMADEAVKDMQTASVYFSTGDYKDAGYWLVMTYFDIQVCENLIETRPNAAQLAGAKNNSTWYPAVDAGGWQPITPDSRKAIDTMKLYREKLITISNLMKDPAVPYEDIAPQFEQARQEVSEVAKVARSTVTIKSRMIFKYADTPTSVDFLQSALRLLEGLQQSSSNAGDLKNTIWDLYTAKLNLQVGQDVLENQTLIFESGGKINWKTLQDYNLKLQSAEINLYKAKRDIMNTVIISPSNGTIFSVNLKVNDPLSAEDYATRPAVGLVNTRVIKFTGKVDEIDIMKVHVGDNATVTVDAIPDKEFNWKVKFISPFGAKSGNVVKFDVIIVPTGLPEDDLKDGLRATAEIVTSSVKDALLVPVSYVITTPGGSMVLLINSKTGQAEPRRVTTGLQNFQYTEITSGLADGDRIQMPGNMPSGSMVAPIRQPTGPGGAVRALR